MSALLTSDSPKSSLMSSPCSIYISMKQSRLSLIHQNNHNYSKETTQEEDDVLSVGFGCLQLLAGLFDFPSNLHLIVDIVNDFIGRLALQTVCGIVKSFLKFLKQQLSTADIVSFCCLCDEVAIFQISPQLVISPVQPHLVHSTQTASLPCE